MDNKQINQAKSEDETDLLNHCVQYAKVILNEQLARIKSKNMTLRLNLNS